MNKKIEFKQVFLNEEGVNMLENISFSITDKKIVGLLGRRNSGKKSLLSLLASYRLPSKGEVLVDGEVVFENPEKMEQVDFVYQEDYKDEDDTVEGILNLYCRFRPNFDKKYADELMERFGVPLDKKIKECPIETQLILTVILGLVGRTAITIIDEAFVELDVIARDRLYEEIEREQRNHPRVFILSTNHFSEIEYLFDEVIYLNKGKLVCHEDYETLLAKGAKIIGDPEDVDKVAAPYKIIKEKIYKRVKEVSVVNIDSNRLKEKTEGLNVEIQPISLHYLLNHMAEEGNQHV